jgi:Na+/melibiose symporter-like transporter
MNRLPKSAVNTYAFFVFTMTLSIIVPLSYFTIFLTDNLMMSATLLGAIILFSRLIDIIVGLISSPIMQSARQKGTKHGAWLNVFRWFMSIGGILMFMNTSSLPMAARVVISILAYCAVNCAMNFIQTSYYSMMSVMAGPSMEDRNLMSIRGTQFSNIAMLIASMSAIPAIKWLTPIIGSANSYTLVAAAFALPMIYGSGRLKKIADNYDTGAGGGPVISVGDMVKSVATNSQLLIILMANTLLNINLYVIQTLMTYYFSYILGNLLYMTLATTISTSFGIVAAIIGPKIGIRMGKKNAMVFGMFFAVVTNILIFFFARHSVWPGIIIGCFASIAMYTWFGFTVNYVLDAGEYHLYKTGQDNRVVAMGTMVMPIKIGLWVGGAIGSFGLAAIGYTAGMTATPRFVAHFMALYALVPAACSLIAGLLVLFGYHITDKDAAFYAKENAERLTTTMTAARDGQSLSLASEN